MSMRMFERVQKSVQINYGNLYLLKNTDSAEGRGRMNNTTSSYSGDVELRTLKLHQLF